MLVPGLLPAAVQATANAAVAAARLGPLLPPPLLSPLGALARARNEAVVPANGAAFRELGLAWDGALPPLTLAEEVHLHSAAALWQHCAEPYAASPPPLLRDAGATRAPTVPATAASATAAAVAAASALAWALEPQATALLGFRRAHTVAAFIAGGTFGPTAALRAALKAAARPATAAAATTTGARAGTAEAEADGDLAAETDAAARRRIGEMAARAVHHAARQAQARAAEAAAQGVALSLSAALRK